jgi:hypothetical protein
MKYKRSTVYACPVQRNLSKHQIKKYLEEHYAGLYKFNESMGCRIRKFGSATKSERIVIIGHTWALADIFTDIGEMIRSSPRVMVVILFSCLSTEYAKKISEECINIRFVGFKGRARFSAEYEKSIIKVDPEDKERIDLFMSSCNTAMYLNGEEVRHGSYIRC